MPFLRENPLCYYKRQLYNEQNLVLCPQNLENFFAETIMSETLLKQIEQGFEALKQLTKKEEDELVAEDPNVTLIFTLWQNFECKSQYPFTIPVRHNLYENSTLRVVLITKDPHAEWKEKIRELDYPVEIKTYSVKKFGERFKETYNARQLIKDTRCFLADSRVSHVLNTKLTEEFYKKKKIPILVDLTGEDLAAPIDAALNSSPVILPKGNKFAAPVGKLSWEAANIAENACDVINGIFAKVGKENIATIHIRIPSSLTIPVYTADITSVIKE